MDDLLKRIGQMGLVPVVVVEDEDKAPGVANALIEGGLPIMEVTLRTQAAIASIKKIKNEFPKMLLGAGTVLSVDKAKEAVDAGAEFIVAPGFNEKLVSWCLDNSVTVTPGCVTPTEIEHAMSFGLNVIKFFPADVFGGVNGCKALSGPFKTVKFIPTGGVGLGNLKDFADKEYIHAIGGGWLCPASEIASGNFEAIKAAARESISILLGFEFAHIGINQPAADSSLKVAGEFSRAFGFALKEGASSNFSGSGIEVNKEIGLGKMGHIAIRTNSIERAVYYLSKKGYEVDWSTRKGPEGRRPVAVYLKDEIGGFAIHLLQK